MRMRNATWLWFCLAACSPYKLNFAEQSTCREDAAACADAGPDAATETGAVERSSDASLPDPTEADAGPVVAPQGGAAGAMGPARDPSPPTGPRCGNGIREGAELCDGDCPKTCPASNACVPAKLEGSAAGCDARCIPAEITKCGGAADGCCPIGCNHNTDTDCSQSCGDGALTGAEKCEPGSADHPCPMLEDCDDKDPCTEDKVTGAAAQCSAECAHTRITRMPAACDDDDPCTDDTSMESSTSCSYDCMHSTPRTPTGSCVDTDPCTDDTPLKSITRCAYECPHRRQQPTAAACDDGDPCTDDTPEMSRTQCAFECPHDSLPDGTPCMTTGTCNSGRCQYCGDGVVNRGEECDPAATGWNSTTCSSACKRTMYKRCNANSQCSNGQSCWAGYCTTACTENTTPNGPGTECPRIPNVPEPFCYTNKCVLPCRAVSDCPVGLDQCDNSATLGFSGNGTTCSSTALGNP